MFRKCDERECGTSDKAWRRLYLQRGVDALCADPGSVCKKTSCGGVILPFSGDSGNSVSPGTGGNREETDENLWGGVPEIEKKNEFLKE